MSIATTSDLETAPARAYGCGFINVPQLIAAYNMAHSREIDGVGPKLDLKYWFPLGPQILPVLESRLHHIPALQPYVAGFRSHQDIEAGRRGRSNWRAWGFRTWRLHRYLANNPAASSNPSGSGRG